MPSGFPWRKGGKGLHGATPCDRVGSLKEGNVVVVSYSGKEINAKRLEAVPWTRHCIECQEKAEKGQLEARAQVEVGRRNRLEEALQKWIRVFDLAGWGAAIVDGTDLRIDAGLEPARQQALGL